MDDKGKKKFSKGMVFGVFDIFHPGHEFFLNKASQMCEDLTVVMTQSEIVMRLKNNLPINSFESRSERVKKFNSDIRIIPGDKELGKWSVFEKSLPNIVILGYDQKGIAAELDKINIPYLFLEPHHPEIYKSSLYKSKK